MYLVARRNNWFQLTLETALAFDLFGGVQEMPPLYTSKSWTCDFKEVGSFIKLR